MTDRTAARSDPPDSTGVQRGVDARRRRPTSRAITADIPSARDRRGTALGALDATVPPPAVDIGQPRVLLIHDAPWSSQPLSLLLSDEAFVVDSAGFDGWPAVLDDRRPALILLRARSTSERVFELIRAIRRRTAAPIVVLASGSSTTDPVLALELGADDFMSTPFDPDELAARLRAVLRRGERHTRFVPPLVVGDLTIDFERRFLVRDGAIVPLGRTEWLVLRHLARNQGKVVLNTELLSAVWGEGYGDDLQVLRICISRLRHKLGTTRRGEGPIRTFHNVGYALDTD